MAACKNCMNLLCNNQEDTDLIDIPAPWPKSLGPFCSNLEPKAECCSKKPKTYFHWPFICSVKKFIDRTKGIRIAFNDDPPSLLHWTLEFFLSQQREKSSTAVEKLLSPTAIEEVKHTSPLGFYSHRFLVLKLDGSFHPIIYLKVLNWHLEVPSFYMDTLFSMIAALCTQKRIIKIDLKDAYHNFLVLHRNTSDLLWPLSLTGLEYYLSAYLLHLGNSQTSSSLSASFQVSKHQGSCLPGWWDNQDGFSGASFCWSITG